MMSARRDHPAGTIHTVGHSTRSIDEFIALLDAHRIELLVDVRQFPRSRRMPHFNAELLARSLEARGIDYRHLQSLGGRRKAAPDSINTGWREEGFRGYADSMQSDEFRRAIDELMEAAKRRRTAIMCAEALYWRCHRRLIADALLVRGLTVLHIFDAIKAEPHELPAFAQVDGEVITYPAAQSELFHRG